MVNSHHSHHLSALFEIKNIPVLIGLILGAAILRFILNCFYNVYFHPLRKFPGPKLAAATGLVFFYNTLRGEEVSWETKTHKRYGEVVRLGPDRLSYVTPKAWKDVAGPGIGKRLENSKDRRMFGPDLHGRNERFFSPAFSDRALKLQEPLILGYLNSLVRIIRNNATASPPVAFDMVKLLNCMTFDVMADLTFGEPLGLLDQSELTPWVETIFKNLQMMSISRVATEYKALGRLVKMLTPKEFTKGAYAHYDHSHERVERRLQQGVDIGKPDVWGLVMESTGEAPKLAKKEMTANAQTFMVAGTETTATLLSGLTFLLLTHPHYMKRLQEEVRVLQKEELSLERVAHLPFLNACIQEGLRYYPPAPIPFFREVAKGGNTICGEFIPAGTRIAVSHFAAYHHPSNFKDPDSFIPERWLPGYGYDSDRKDVLNPFSVGPRNCLGQNLANHEMRVILAHLTWHFDFELCPESRNWIDQKVYLLWKKPKLMVKANYIR